MTRSAPLPHFRRKEPHVINQKDKLRTVTGKTLIRKSEFDHWMEEFRHKPDIDIDKLLDEVLQELGLPLSSNRGRRVKRGTPRSYAS